MRPKTLPEILELYGDFLLRLCVPMLLTALLSGVLVSLFVATRTAPLLAVVVWPLQVGAWFITDLLLTGRSTGDRMIATLAAARPDEALPESLIWISIGIISFAVMLISFSCPAPWIVPVLITGVPHFLLLFLLATDRDTFSVFAREVFPALRDARQQKRRERRKALEAGRLKRQQKRRERQQERERRHEQEQVKKEKRRKPKPFTQQIGERHAQCQKVIDHLRALKNVDPEIIEQAIESAQGTFNTWLVDSAQQDDSLQDDDDSFGA